MTESQTHSASGKDAGNKIQAFKKRKRKETFFLSFAFRQLKILDGWGMLLHSAQDIRPPQRYCPNNRGVQRLSRDRLASGIILSSSWVSWAELQQVKGTRKGQNPMGLHHILPSLIFSTNSMPEKRTKKCAIGANDALFYQVFHIMRSRFHSLCLLFRHSNLSIVWLGKQYHMDDNKN